MIRRGQICARGVLLGLLLLGGGCWNASTDGSSPDGGSDAGEGLDGSTPDGSVPDGSVPDGSSSACTTTSLQPPRLGAGLGDLPFDVADLEVLPGGDFIVAGHAIGDLTVGGITLPDRGHPLEWDIVLLRLNQDGSVPWAIRPAEGGHAQISASSLFVELVGTDRIVVGGSYSGEADFGGGVTLTDQAFVATYDDSGQLVRANAFEHASDTYSLVMSLTSNPAGEVFVVGYLAGAVTFGDLVVDAPEGASFLLRVDAAGIPRKLQTFSGTGSLWVTAVGVAESGDILLTGALYGQVDFGDGVPVGDPQDANTIFVAAIRESGAIHWVRVLGLTGIDYRMGLALELESCGDIVVAGVADGSVDFGDGVVTHGGQEPFVMALDEEGRTLWSRRYPLTEVNEASQPYYGHIQAVTEVSEHLVVTGFLQGGFAAFTTPPAESAYNYEHRFVLIMSRTGEILSHRDWDATSWDDRGFTTPIAVGGSHGVLTLGEGRLLRVMLE